MIVLDIVSKMASCLELIAFISLLVLGHAPQGQSQLHWGITPAPTDVVECYNCSPFHKGFEFPQCLYVVETCAPGQKCSILYKPDQGLGAGPVIGCSEQCYLVQETPLLCPYGGGILPNWECYSCCKDSSCVTHLTTQLSRDYFLSPKVFCPGHCHRSNLTACMSTGIECVASEFCVMSYDSNAQTIQGLCRDASPQAAAACEAQAQAQKLCVHRPNEMSKDPGVTQPSCLWGCLKNNVEVMVLFNHYPIHDFMTTEAPGQTQRPLQTLPPP